MERVPGVRVSKTVPELGACVSAPSEVRRCGHGVADTVFAFRTPGRPREPAGLPTVGKTSFTHWVKSVTLCGRMLSGGFGTIGGLDAGFAGRVRDERFVQRFQQGVAVPESGDKGDLARNTGYFP